MAGAKPPKSFGRAGERPARMIDAVRSGVMRGAVLVVMLIAVAGSASAVYVLGVESGRRSHDDAGTGTSAAQAGTITRDGNGRSRGPGAYFQPPVRHRRSERPGQEPPASTSPVDIAVVRGRRLPPPPRPSTPQETGTAPTSAELAALEEEGVPEPGHDSGPGPLAGGWSIRMEWQAIAARAAARPPGERPPWVRHAVPVALPAGRPVIVVVIDDLGLNSRINDRVLALPGPLTLAYLPYGTDLPRQTAKARAAGHELMLHMPMQPTSDTKNPGPDALLTGLSPADNVARLTAALDRFDGYVGINNHMGSRFTSDPVQMQAVIGELGRRGLLYLDSRTSGSSKGFRLARQLGVATAARDVFIDHELDPAAIARALSQIEAVARRHGVAIGIGHPHRATLAALERWLPTLAERGFVLAPVSAVVEYGGMTIAEEQGNAG